MGGPAGSLRSRQHSSRGHRGTQAPPPRQGSSQEENTVTAKISGNALKGGIKVVLGPWLKLEKGFFVYYKTVVNKKK